MYLMIYQMIWKILIEPIIIIVIIILLLLLFL